MRTRRFGLIVIAGFSWLAGAARAEGPVYVVPPAVADPGHPEAKSAVIKPLLPQSAGQAVCFSGTFPDKSLDMEDWSHTTLEVVPGVLQFGEPVMRPVPRHLPGQKVTGLTLSLTYDDRSSDYDWIYNFRLMATLDDGRPVLFASGECPWYDKTKTVEDRGEVKGNTDHLGCYIDCDGGGMGMTRISGTTGLDLRFWGDGLGLRMSAGCGGRGSYRLGTGDADDDVPFHLAPAGAAQCAPLEAWANED